MFRAKKGVMKTISLYCYKFRAQVNFHLKKYVNTMKIIQKALKKTTNE